MQPIKMLQLLGSPQSSDKNSFPNTLIHPVIMDASVMPAIRARLFPSLSPDRGSGQHSCQYSLQLMPYQWLTDDGIAL